MKIAIVTGAKGGIGRKIANLLSKNGIKVIGIEKEVDVGNYKRVNQTVKKIIKKYRRIDIVVNNAGVAIYKPVIETTGKEWQKTIDTNLTGVFNVASAVLPLMLKQKSGVIINIASMAGRRAHPGLAAYCASKFGVIGFSDTLAMELKGSGVKVFSVLPGGVDTKMYHEISKVESRYVGLEYEPAEERKILLKPQDVAELVASLALNPKKTISGTKIEIFKMGRRVVKRLI